MSTLVFDVEANGFLDATKMHCIVTQDVDTMEIETYYEDKEEIYQGLLALYNADCIIGHNIISFDIELIKRFYPKWTYKSCIDTFILSSIFNPDRFSHSIESYSSGRKVQISDWSCLTYEILDRCVIDVIVNTEIYHSFKDRISMDMWKNAIELEHQVAKNHVKQVEAGVDVDKERLLGTLGCLDAELEALRSLIEQDVPYRCIPGAQYKKLFKKNGDLLSYVYKYFDEDAMPWIL